MSSPDAYRWAPSQARPPEARLAQVVAHAMFHSVRNVAVRQRHLYAEGSLVGAELTGSINDSVITDVAQGIELALRYDVRGNDEFFITNDETVMRTPSSELLSTPKLARPKLPPDHLLLTMSEGQTHLRHSLPIRPIG